MNRRLSIFILLALLLAATALLGGTVPSGAGAAKLGSPSVAPLEPEGGSERDEWEQTDPTEWYWWHSQTPTQVTDLLTANNIRIVDLEVQQVSPLLLTFATVKSTGAYAKASWWYPSLTVTEIGNKLNENQARLIDIEAYEVSGVTRYSVVMVSNTGVDNKAWWWYPSVDASYVSNRLTVNNARLVDLESHLVGGVRKYTVVMIAKTGDDNVASWWYPNLTPAEVITRLNQNQARLIDIQQETSGRYAVIMQACPCPLWFYYYGATESDVNALTGQNGARLIDIETYLVSGQRRFDVVMHNNSNEVTTRVGNILRAGIVNSSGGYAPASAGLYLRQISGQFSFTLADLYGGKVFEPASTIKVVAHLYAMQRVQAGAVTLNTQIPRYPYDPNSCPGSTTSGTDTLRTALTEMMQDSDNARTRGVVDYFGRTTINNNTHAIGMNNTTLNHVLGCGGPTPNTMTLREAGILYEGVARGTLLNAANRTTFYELMAGKNYDFTGIWSKTQEIIEQEAPAGMTTAQKQAFKDRVEMSYKAGGYGLNCDPNCEFYLSVAGFAQIPTCSAGTIGSRQYAFGIFLDAVTSQTAANNTFNAAKAELLREQVRSALSNWATCLQPSSTPTRTAVPPTQTRTRTPVPPSNTPTHTNTPQPTQTPGGPSATPIPTNTPTNTSTPVPPTDTPQPTQTPGGPSATPMPTDTPVVVEPTATPTQSVPPTACPIQFADVSTSNTFYANVRCLACRGIDTGYECGGTGEPCNSNSDPYFRPNSLIKRDDLAHMVAASAGFGEDPGARRFQDVPTSNPYYAWVQRMANRNLIGGYPCGGPGEPCVAPDNLAYYRPQANATRGQISKIVSNGAGFEDTPEGQTFEDVQPSNPFYVWVQRLTRPDRAVMGGYPCGGAGEPCIAPDNRSYFRWGNNSTRGQVAKITSNTFFPGCQTP